MPMCPLTRQGARSRKVALKTVSNLNEYSKYFRSDSQRKRNSKRTIRVVILPRTVTKNRSIAVRMIPKKMGTNQTMV